MLARGLGGHLFFLLSVYENEVVGLRKELTGHPLRKGASRPWSNLDVREYLKGAMLLKTKTKTKQHSQTKGKGLPFKTWRDAHL